MNRVLEYFDRQAAAYERNIKSNPIWKFFREREKEAILRFLSPQACDSILDAGSGPGFYAEELRKVGCQVACVDISPRMIQAVREKGIEGHQGALESVALDKKFNKIICAGVFEFLLSPLEALHNLRRHLKKNGFIVLQLPKNCGLGYAYKAIHRAHSLPVRLFSRVSLQGLCDNSGMRLLESDNPGGLSWVLKLVPSE